MLLNIKRNPIITMENKNAIYSKNLVKYYGRVEALQCSCSNAVIFMSVEKAVGACP
jgi:hypothetical protein